MSNLLRFFKLNQFLFLFLLIEGFSIFLLITNNTYQANKTIKYTTQYTSMIYNYSHLVSNYIKLREINKHLVAENAKLHSILKNIESSTTPILINNKKFSYQSAKVINNSINKRNNFITLNKGQKHGVKKGMGVVTEKGVVGIIHSSSKNYSIAISLLHRKSSVGIKLKKNNHNGILIWKGFNYKIANITNFPSHIKINKGDSIITNSHSLIFPENIHIGVIENFEKDYEGYFNVTVSLCEDFNNLDFVYIIHANELEEQKNLELKIKQ